MPKPATIYVRNAVLIFFKGYAPVASIVAERIHESVPVNPVWPYVRWGVPTATPRLATGIDGTLLDVTLHAFAEGASSDEAQALTDALQVGLGDRTLMLDAPFPAKVNFRWTQSQVLKDIAKADGWHGIVRFDGVIVA